MYNTSDPVMKAARFEFDHSDMGDKALDFETWYARKQKKQKMYKKYINKALTVQGYKTVSYIIQSFLKEMINGEIDMKYLSGNSLGEVDIELQSIEENDQVPSKNTQPPQLIEKNEKNTLITMHKKSHMNSFEVFGRALTKVNEYGKSIIHVTHPDQLMWALQARDQMFRCDGIVVGDLNSYVYSKDGKNYFHLYYTVKK